MTITYEVGSGLYVNITNRCTCACDFCVRTKPDGISTGTTGDRLYGGEGSLWLDREPTLDETKADIDRRDLSKYDELVFCGYGEPTERLVDMIATAKYVKSISDIPIRLNTNGHAALIADKSPDEIAPMFKDAIDIVSISLNTAHADDYVDICHPEHGEAAHNALLAFGKAVAPYVKEVIYTVVRTTDPHEDLDLCRQLAEDNGGKLRVRELL